MAEISNKYKKIVEDLEKNIKDPETLDFVRGKFAEASLLFVDLIDRITRLTDSKVEEIEQKQDEIHQRLNYVKSLVDGIEEDIYEDDDDDSYEFEIVCPYCNYEFTADIDDEDSDEIQCPECHNTIELDWNMEDELGGCAHCHNTNCIAEDEDKYSSEDDDDNKEEDKQDNTDEDM